MIVCPRCGNENLEGSKFCSNCGNALTGLAGAPATNPTVVDDSAAQSLPPPVPEPPPPPVEHSPSPMPPPIPEPRTWEPRPIAAANAASGLPATAPEWRMSDAGPLPEPRGRRRWLWIAIGILAACILACAALTIWGNSESGTRTINNFLTSQAEAGTPGAGTPTGGSSE